MKKSLPIISKIMILGFLYLVLGIVVTFPLIKNINTQIPNNLYTEAEHTYIWGDHLQIVAGFREHKNYLENILEGKPLYQKEMCFEDIEDCKLSTFETVKYVVFSPYWIHTTLNIVFDDPLVYNLAILMSFLTTGFAGYILSSYFLQKFSKPDKSILLSLHPELAEGPFSFVTIQILSFISSIFVLLAPIRIHHLLVGHKNGFLYFLPILMIYFLEKFVDKRKFTDIMWVSLILIFLAFNEQFFTYFGIIYICFRIAFAEFSNLKKGWTKNIRSLFLSYIKHYWFLVFSFLVSSLINVYSKLEEIATSNISDGRAFEHIIGNSPKSLSYLFDPFILEHEQNIYMSIGIFVLLIGFGISIYFIYSNSRSQKLSQDGKNLAFFSFFALFFLILALGSLTPVYKIFYDYIPAFDLSRTPARAMFFVFPFVVIIFSYILAKIFEKFKFTKIKKFGIIIFLGLIVIVPFINFRPISLTYLPESVDFMDNERILFVPIKPTQDFYNSIYEFQISNFNSVMLNGYHPYQIEEVREFEENYMERINKLYLNGKTIDDDPEVAKYIRDLDVTGIIEIKDYSKD